MKLNDVILNGYENAKLIGHGELDSATVIPFDKLPQTEVRGVLKSNFYSDGKLMQSYSENDSHVGVIAATRLGKTTSYVIPTIISFAMQKVKKSMVISDPKGELYRNTAELLRSQGYVVKLINFREYTHSECWNMLTPIYRKYQSAFEIDKQVEVVCDEKGNYRNKFQGRVYKSQKALDGDIERLRTMIIEEVGNDIDNLALMQIQTYNTRDPYWEDSAREYLKGFLWAMLEDSRSDDPNKRGNLITEDTFSYSTIFNIINTFKDEGKSFDDGGYFSDRPHDSRAYGLVKNIVLENGDVTRRCIVSCFMTRMSVFRECAMRLITSCNSFEMSLLAEGPVAIFINYRDELKAHYEVISLFVQNAYQYLIKRANERFEGKLEVPFYFILDEFGNFPAIKDFDTTISACAGRNIFFMLIIQSYAQLNSVYGDKVADIIKDNLNIHVFFGSNNPKTLEEFSLECGKHSRIAPTSALNGHTSEMEIFNIETIPLVPVSTLSHFTTGDCIVTEANCGYVLWSHLERYYMCKEMKDLKQSDIREYKCSVNPFDPRYTYKFKRRRGRYDFGEF